MSKKLTRKEVSKMWERWEEGWSHSSVATQAAHIEKLLRHIEEVGEFAEPEPTEEERIHNLLRRVAELGGPIGVDDEMCWFGDGDGEWAFDLDEPSEQTKLLRDTSLVGVLLRNLEQNGFDWEVRYEQLEEGDPYTVKITIPGKLFVVIRRGKREIEAVLGAWIKIKESLPQ